jgi:hypothetical protein
MPKIAMPCSFSIEFPDQRLKCIWLIKAIEICCIVMLPESSSCGKLKFCVYVREDLNFTFLGTVRMVPVRLLWAWLVMEIL